MFGFKSVGTRFVYVVDRSGSMAGSSSSSILSVTTGLPRRTGPPQSSTSRTSRLTVAKNELIQALRQLKPSTVFYVVFYNQDEQPMPSEDLLPATPSNVERIVQWIQPIQPDDGTDPAPAMLHALKLRPHTIWLLSDGAFRTQSCDEIRDANQKQSTIINTIGFYDKSGERTLKRIADENRGVYRFVAGGTDGPSAAPKAPRARPPTSR